MMKAIILFLRDIVGRLCRFASQGEIKNFLRSFFGNIIYLTGNNGGRRRDGTQQRPLVGQRFHGLDRSTEPPAL